MLKWFSFMAEPCFGHWHYFSMRCASLSLFHVDLFSSLDETKRCYDLVTKKFYRTEEIWTRGEFACAACVCKRNGQLKCWDMKCKVPRCQATARVEGRCCRFCLENSTVKGLWRILIKNRNEADKISTCTNFESIQLVRIPSMISFSFFLLFSVCKFHGKTFFKNEIIVLEDHRSVW